MFEKSFDCVEFQRKVREEAMKEANYDIKTLIEQVNERLKNNDLNNFLIERKEKEKQVDTV
ncbi:MAG: hypothetical protein A2X61_01285 [Ignavibacteria bacterium GWB2_35_12]|nr:MAG: hypothetical protein A2X63_13605 [Ignavibacteria bacterium GWA2_35_8]OGU42042.1 MAG: hypothetical protein A2X61_01285 [Ignavibacteria bacterium GWB2_35_12]OGV18717.1 MAG: hypothetical protein A2475_08885 [Ignavibacteria bacterium RIFOXYC2_FULL_35_21]